MTGSSFLSIKVVDVSSGRWMFQLPELPYLTSDGLALFRLALSVKITLCMENRYDGGSPGLNIGACHVL